MIGLHCPRCGGECSVVDSRASRLGDIPTIARRRRCDNCDHRWSTYELAATAIAAVEARLAEAQTIVAAVRALAPAATASRK